MQSANEPSENGAKLKHLGTRVRNQKYFHQESKSRLNLGNAVQNPLSSRPLSRSTISEIFKLPFCVFLYETKILRIPAP